MDLNLASVARPKLRVSAGEMGRTGSSNLILWVLLISCARKSIWLISPICDNGKSTPHSVQVAPASSIAKAPLSNGQASRQVESNGIIRALVHLVTWFSSARLVSNSKCNTNGIGCGHEQTIQPPLH